MDFGETDLILFVAGEPDSGMDPFRDVESPFVRLFVGSGRMFGLRQPGASPSTADPHTRSNAAPRLLLPPDQAQCVQEVVEIAGHERQRVMVVDVNRATGPQDLIARWVGAKDVFPILVRSDGARLEGVEGFLTRKLRAFIRARGSGGTS